MTTSTLEDRETFHLTDAVGNTADLLTIDGKGLEDYFAGTDLVAPVGNQVAFVDGVLQRDLSAPIEPGVSVMIGEAPVNG
jgi:hypothetical protein